MIGHYQPPAHWRLRSAGLALVMLLAGGFFAGTGGYLLATSVPEVVEALRASRYTPVPATVVQSSLVQTSTTLNSVPLHEVKVKYTYVVAGRQHTSDRTAPGGLTARGAAEGQRLLANYPVGARITAFYDPRDPSRALLSKAAGHDPYLHSIFGTPFFLVGILVLTAGLASLTQTARMPVPGKSRAVTSGDRTTVYLGMRAPNAGRDRKAVVVAFVACIAVALIPTSLGVMGVYMAMWIPPVVWALQATLFLTVVAMLCTSLRSRTRALEIDTSLRSLSIPARAGRRVVPFELIADIEVVSRVNRFLARFQDADACGHPTEHWVVLKSPDLETDVGCWETRELAEEFASWLRAALEPGIPAPSDPVPSSA